MEMQEIRSEKCFIRLQTNWNWKPIETLYYIHSIHSEIFPCRSSHHSTLLTGHRERVRRSNACSRSIASICCHGWHSMSRQIQYWPFDFTAFINEFASIACIYDSKMYNTLFQCEWNPFATLLKKKKRIIGNREIAQFCRSINPDLLTPGNECNWRAKFRF